VGSADHLVRGQVCAFVAEDACEHLTRGHVLGHGVVAGLRLGVVALSVSMEVAARSPSPS
jgi:hypothetical protein